MVVKTLCAAKCQCHVADEYRHKCVNRRQNVEWKPFQFELITQQFSALFVTYKQITLNMLIYEYMQRVKTHTQEEYVNGKVIFSAVMFRGLHKNWEISV